MTDRNNWEYRFLDDALFDLVRPDLADKLNHHKAMMSDLARLVWAASVLDGSADVDQVIWIDADVFVFDDALFEVGSRYEFAVGRQNWVQPGNDATLKVYRQVQNAILVLGRLSPHLDFLIHTITRMIERMEEIGSPQMFGPKLLTALHNIVGFDVAERVDMASPLVLQDLAQGGGRALTALLNASSTQPSALNLCSSYRNKTIDGVVCRDELYDQAIDYLEQHGLNKQA